MSLRSSGNSGGAKVGRKVRVALGKSEGSGDGARSSGLKNSNSGRTRTRVVFSTRESKRLSDDAGTVELKKRGGRRIKSRRDGDGDGDGADVGERLGGKAGIGKRILKKNDKNERFEEGGDGKSKQVWKNAFGKGTLRKIERVKESLVTRKESEYNAISDGNAHKKRDQNIYLGSDGKSRQVRKNATEDGTLGKMERVKDSSGTRKGSEYNAGFVGKAHKKRDQERDNLATNVDLMENPLKKKKRTLRISIRIDPYDTSNKRLDDDINNNGNDQSKKGLEEDGVEMSKNAQFRAICPSPSILSFVEDNLLGRRRQIEFKRAGYNNELSCPLDNIPFSTNTEREQIEIPIFKNKLEFFAAAKVSSSFPPPTHPEIAFAGRSNVGKSSLLNSLTRQWGVVRTSDKPGLTQTINFFKLGPKINLVDLPGYGFAYAKDEIKEAWEELVKEYVSTRSNLKRVCLLIDTKWGIKPRDYELIDLMERSQTKYQIVLTKTDLVFPMDVARRAMQIEENLKAKKSAVQPLMMVSSKTGAGIRSLRTALSHIARFVKR